MRRRVISLFVAFVLVVGAALATQSVWKPMARRSKWFLISTNLYQDLLRRAHLRTDQIDQELPPSAQAADYSDVVTRTDVIFDQYLSHSGLREEDLRGKDVLELGPGYNLGVALRFIGAGARSFTAIDKFIPFQDTAYNRGLYAAIRDRLDAPARARVDAAVNLDGHVTLREPALRYVYAKGVEDHPFQPSSFDLVISHAVLEEIYDLDRAFDAMDEVLRPGGYSIHKIDLRDYGMFTRNGFHSLEFLTIPDPVYRRMAENTGQPNRRLVDYYRGKTAALGYDTTIYATHVLGRQAELQPHKQTLVRGVDYTDETIKSLQSIRPRLLERYQKLPDEDLLVQGIILVAHKPVTPTKLAAR
jgi:SAM-dependent methyltransferase